MSSRSRVTLSIATAIGVTGSALIGVGALGLDAASAADLCPPGTTLYQAAPPSFGAVPDAGQTPAFPQPAAVDFADPFATMGPADPDSYLCILTNPGAGSAVTPAPQPDPLAPVALPPAPLPAPVAPAPLPPAPVAPAPLPPAPVAPAPVPVLPEPVAPAPVPVLPEPVVPAPVPVQPEPVAPAPVPVLPEPVAPAPVAPEPPYGPVEPAESDSGPSPDYSPDGQPIGSGTPGPTLPAPAPPLPAPAPPGGPQPELPPGVIPPAGPEGDMPEGDMPEEDMPEEDMPEEDMPEEDMREEDMREEDMREEDMREEKRDTTGEITRAEVLGRSASWVLQQVPYSQTSWWTDENGTYRQDCSGYVSMAWGLDQRTNYWTGNLASVSHRIASSSLKAGDILILPREHLVIFAGWANSAKTKFHLYEQYSRGKPARYLTDADLDYYLDRGYGAYRYDDIADVERGRAGPQSTVFEMASFTAPLDGAADQVAVNPEPAPALRGIAWTPALAAQVQPETSTPVSSAGAFTPPPVPELPVETLKAAQLVTDQRALRSESQESSGMILIAAGLGLLFLGFPLTAGARYGVWSPRLPHPGRAS